MEQACCSTERSSEGGKARPCMLPSFMAPRPNMSCDRSCALHPPSRASTACSGGGHSLRSSPLKERAQLLCTCQGALWTWCRGPTRLHAIHQRESEIPAHDLFKCGRAACLLQSTNDQGGLPTRQSDCKFGGM